MARSDPRRRDPRSVLNHGDGYHPPCFDSAEQFAQWRMLLARSGGGMRVGFCLDCTPEYKMEMMCQDRCTHPETQFIVLRDHQDPEEVSVVGVSSASIYWARVERGVVVIDEGKDGEDQQPS